jgi:hypothetical protein
LNITARYTASITRQVLFVNDDSVSEPGILTSHMTASSVQIDEKISTDAMNNDLSLIITPYITTSLL